LADPHRGLADAQEAERLARSCGSTDWLEQAGYCQVLCLKNLGRNEEARLKARTLFEELLAAGSVWGYALGELAAGESLRGGRWGESRELLRRALAARCEGILGASIRLTATQLAVRSGRFVEARMHLDRAGELISEDFSWLRTRLLGARAEVLVAAGQPQEALRLLHDRIIVPGGVGANYGEDHLVDVARAAAETARAARDTGDAYGVTRAIAVVDDLIGNWPGEPFTTPRPDVADQKMAKALFDAELARLRQQTGQAELWSDAIDRCHAAGDPWREAMSRLRCAEATLAAGAPAASVTELLRQAHRTAVELGAQPLQMEVESLARIARVSLRQPVATAGILRTPDLLAGLTTREREILSFLVAGWSNGEIAKELVISVKTVSVHVTNILRKTGTASRVEAAALAERLGIGRDD
jgi:DNA-binding CsgD family transcriptional regulator